MQYINYLDRLNERQYEAVTTSRQNVRVVAGAGSGKTTVLTYRIAYLITEFDASPNSIVAFTFTNKVAAEMKNRVINIYPDAQKDLCIKTFHSFAAMFLRREIDAIGFPRTFTILDDLDQTKLIKDIAAEFGYKKSDKIVSMALNYIASNKLRAKYPSDINITHIRFPEEKTCLEIYERYEEEKDKMLSLDFDDLLLKTNYILENFPEIRARWQYRIDYILIDEFQDTNDVEFKMIQYLKKPECSIYVVGDPDQTIYTWRGANQNIMLDFDKHFRDVQTIILDRNYRSTQTILNAANHLIDYNRMRVKKDLYTKNALGDKINVKRASSSKLEADYVAREIKKLKATGQYEYKDIVILYRSNYITVDFETVLTSYGIQYRIYGGTKFYQRREIKDVLSYFHLIINTLDDVSFERIINVPKRGIGETSLSIIKAEALANKKSLYNYVKEVDANDSNAPKKAINALKTMIKRIDVTRDLIAKDEETFSKTLEDMIIDFDYYNYLSQEEDGDERIENVKALFQDIRHYLSENPESTFEEYLQNIALLSAQDDYEEGDYVTLMTVHTAKGLEFPVVFLVRFNEGVFPNNRALIEEGHKGLEEERRLAYVAYTRAKNLLYISYTEDFSYVLGGYLKISQFVQQSELHPDDRNKKYIDYDRYQSRNSSYQYDAFSNRENNNSTFDLNDHHVQDLKPKTNGINEWHVGEIVLHKTLGRGVVIGVEGDDIISVNFDDHGIKKMLGNHPAIKKGE